MKYSLIFPVFNEQANIQKLYQRTKTVIEKLSLDYELLFINDGSTDNSLELLRELHQKNSRVKIINFSRNFGHQTAITAGLNHATGEQIAILDADLQDPPEVLPQFFTKLDQGYDIVYAIREKRKESLLKRTLYSSFYRILRLSANISIPLDSGDFCVLNSRTLKAINSLPERNRFVRGLRSWVGFKQTGIKYERAARQAGESKYTTFKLFKLALDGIFSFTYVPLRLLTVFGFIIFCLSLLGVLIAAYLRIFTTSYNRVPGFATTIILIMFMGGLNMFSLGLVGEYVGRIFDEVKQRPEYVIESKIGF